MSSDKRTVLRHGKSADVGQVNLPQWDRSGKQVSGSSAEKSHPAKSTDVDEQSLKVPTVKELQAIREAAYNEGFEQGYEHGMAEGAKVGKAEGAKQGHEEGMKAGLLAGGKQGKDQALKEAQTQTAEKFQVIDALTTTLKTAVSSEQAQLEQALVVLSGRIASQILQDELTSHPEHLVKLVRSAIQSLPNPEDKLSVFVHPSNKDIVQEAAGRHWHIEADHQLDDRACEIKSGYSYVEASLNARFDAAIAQLVNQSEGELEADSLKNPFSRDNLLLQAEQPSAEQSQTEKSQAERSRQEQPQPEVQAETPAQDNHHSKPYADTAPTETPTIEHPEPIESKPVDDTHLATRQPNQEKSIAGEDVLKTDTSGSPEIDEKGTANQASESIATSSNNHTKTPDFVEQKNDH